ncbi:MAG TPA: hypothetical protein PLP17_13165, partial [Oligoflexia bacterium]|nr:hypothetical protein [Oligoflexia bacterium]
MTNAAHQLTEAERPSLLFFRPHPVQAMAAMPDNPPFWLKWKNNTYRIVAGTGPERIAPEWWGKDDSLCAARDYFKVQLSTGTWMWIFREVETSNWFIHGIWT